MKGYMLVTVMALLAILSISALYSAREGLWMLQNSLLERDKFQLEALMDEAWLGAEHWMIHLPIPLVAVDLHECVAAPCVIFAQASNFFLEQPRNAWQMAHPALLHLSLSVPAMQAAWLFELISTRVDPQTQLLQEYLRGTLILFNADQYFFQFQTYFERSVPQALDYQQGTADLTTLKGGSEIKVRRLAWRRGMNTSK